MPVDSIIIRLLFLLLICLNFSCGNYFYAPNDPVYVGLEKKNDVHFNIGTPSTSVQLGYSPIKHLGIASSYFKLNYNKRSFIDSDSPVSGSRGQVFTNYLGAYYFFANPELEADPYAFYRGFLIDSYIGYGFGNIENNYSNASNSFIKIQKLSWQVGGHIKLQRFELSLIYKASKLNYFDPQLSGTLDPDNFAEVQRLLDNNPFLNHELSYRFSYGINDVKAFIGRTNMIKKHSALNSPSGHFLLGMSMDINDVYRSFFKQRTYKSKYRDPF